MSNPVHNLRFRNALAAYRQHKPTFWGLEDVVATFRQFGYELSNDEVETFWLWMCRGNVRSVSHFTAEYILWEVEKFIEEFSPLDEDDKFEQDGHA